MVVCTKKIVCERYLTKNPVVLTIEVLLPPREDLENFFMAILTKFSTFEALNGFFRQTNGVSMRGKNVTIASEYFLSHV